VRVCWPTTSSIPRRARWSPRPGQSLTDTLRALRKAGSPRCEVFVPSGRAESPLIKNTLAKDPPPHRERGGAGRADLSRSTRCSGRATRRTSRRRAGARAAVLQPKRYDLGRVGRYKINQRLAASTDPAHTVLTEEDFVAIVRYLSSCTRGAAHRRHRPPRQPPHPLGGRADRQPVLGRPVAHGAPGQGAHVDQHRSGEDLARRPRQRAHGVAR
jgi:hypothetical protein